MTHALVIGGTGMLRGVCVELARRGTDVSVVARSHARLAGTAQSAAPGRVHPLAADYRDDEALAMALRTAGHARGPVDLAVCWVHSDAPRAMVLVADQLLPRTGVFHVVGCERHNLSRDAETQMLRGQFPALRWRRIVLGFVIEGTASRWLTHEEICAGALRAIDEDREESVIGTVTPWERCPPL